MSLTDSKTISDQEVSLVLVIGFRGLSSTFWLNSLSPPASTTYREHTLNPRWKRMLSTLLWLSLEWKWEPR